MIEVPKDLGELLRDPERIRKAFELLRALENMSVTMGGVKYPVQISPRNSVINIGTAPGPASGSSETLEAETMTWMALVDANFGTMASDSVAIANALMVELNAQSYRGKIKYLLPLLGATMPAARCPLIDALGVGAAVNTGFVDGDFSQTTGLQADNSRANFWNTKIILGNLNGAPSGYKFGWGYWERASTGSYAAVIGRYNPPISDFLMEMNGADIRWFCGQSLGEEVTGTGQNGNHHFYGQRNSQTDRTLYVNGAPVASSVVSDSADSFSQISTLEMYFMGKHNSAGWGDHRGGVCYFTDGEMTDPDIASLHSILDTYLITATGR